MGVKGFTLLLVKFTCSKKLQASSLPTQVNLKSITPHVTDAGKLYSTYEKFHPKGDRMALAESTRANLPNMCGS
jgi:hypothetical protein